MTQKQNLFLKAMLEESTITKAAEKAHISRSTAYKYLDDPVFKEELSKRRSEFISDTVRFLQSKLTTCSEVLVDIIEKPYVADQVKVNAINSIFANCKAMTETAEIIERLDDLEKSIAEGGADSEF